MKKVEYIEKYGIDAYNALLEKAKQYYQDNREHRTEYQKQYYEENKGHILEQVKKYNEANRERIAEYKKQRYQDNKEKNCEQKKQYHRTQFGRANILKNGYKKQDKRKGFPADQVVDEDWIIERIFNSSCIYCGDSDWTHLGADRIDNTKGHTSDNCVCACEKCNGKRGNRYTVEEFKEYRRLHPKIEDFLEKQSAKY